MDIEELAVSENNLLGANIRSARRASNLTLEQVGSAVGVSYGSVAKWERDENTPTLEHVFRLAELFQLPLTALVTQQLSGVAAMIPEIEALPENRKKELALLIRDFLDRAI